MRFIGKKKNNRFPKDEASFGSNLNGLRCERIEIDRDELKDSKEDIGEDHMADYIYSLFNHGDQIVVVLY